MSFLMKELLELCKRGEAIVDMKSILMKATSNIFNSYFCSIERKLYDACRFQHTYYMHACAHGHIVHW